MTEPEFSGLSAEMSRASLGDPRRARRLAQITEALRRRPEASFPQAASSASELEGLYRFMNSAHVSPESIVEPHRQGTRERMHAAGEKVVVHDTTYFSFPGEREGLGRLHREDQGFWGHFALAAEVLEQGDRRALGVLGFLTGTRHGSSKWKGAQRTEAHPEASSESERWAQLVNDVRPHVGRDAVHVMDREGDQYALLGHMAEHHDRFVVRLNFDRACQGGERVSDGVHPQPVQAERTIEVQPRRANRDATPRQKRRHPARAGRTARLEIRAAPVTIKRSASAPSHLPKTLTLNAVRVHEPDPPSGQDPIEWTLLTTEPIDTSEQIARIVDFYCARWLIEEYFKALKTGCAFEKRQFESAHALLNTLAVLVPVAWELLWLRHIGRGTPDAPADRALSSLMLQVLKAISRQPLSPDPTAEEVLYAIAALGGHIRRNGPPGWMTLGRGYEELRIAAQGWAAAQAQTCDQS